MKNKDNFIGDAISILMLGGGGAVAWVVLLAFATAILEAIGVGSIFPFIAVITNPGIIQQNPVLRYTYDFVGLDLRNFIIFLGCIFLFIVVAVNMISAANIVVLTKFNWKIYRILSSSLLKNMMARPYHYFLKSNTAELNAIILSYTRRVSDGIVVPILTIITKSASAIMILGVLAWINPIVALVVISVLSPIYGIIYYYAKERLNILGADIASADRSCFKASNEALGGIKDLKILGRTSHAAERLEKATSKLSSGFVRASILARVPKYLIESLSLVTIIAIILWKYISMRNPGAAISLAAVFAYAGYRLLPAAQAIFSALSGMKYNADSAAMILHELGYAELDIPGSGDLQSGGAFIRVPKSKLALKSVSYRYPGEASLVLDSISFEIRVGTHIGLVGASGSGKSTLLDIIAGLLYPEKGGVYLDDVLLYSDRMANWRRNIGYVPQVVFLSDASIAENIAFGVPADQIDEKRVIAAARVAKIHEFISSSLPRGYMTEIGERGIRLSGGQRQRLGIARAAYHDPQVIMLDEATNSLDTKTEEEFTETVKALAGSTTIITVAHRMSAVRYCDSIYVIKEGRIVGAGTYSELEKSSSDFQELLRAAKSLAP